MTERPSSLRTSDLRVSGLRRFDCRALALLLILAVVPALPGCGDEKPQNVEPELTPAEQAAARKEAQIKALEEKVSILLNNVEKFPDRWEELLVNVDGYLVEARWFAGETAHLARKLEAAKQGINTRRDQAAQERLDQLSAQADQLAEQEAYDEAVELLEQFDPAERFAETPAQKKWEAKREEMLRLADAEVDYRRISRTARAYIKTGVLEEIGKGVALLATYPAEFENTSYGKEIREMLDSAFEEYKGLKAEEQALLNVPTEDIEIEEYLGNFSTVPNEGVWSVEEGSVLVGENQGDSNALIMFGDKKWKSYEVEFYLKAPEDQEFRLGATVIPSYRPGQPPRAETYEVVTGTDDWIKVLITFRAGTIKFQDVTSGSELIGDVNPRGDTASVSIGLLPGQEIRVKEIKARVFERWEDDGDEEEDVDPGDSDDDDEDEKK